MTLTLVLLFFALLLYLLDSDLNLEVVQSVFGLAFLLQLFYLVGSWLGSWPLPGPLSVVQIVLVVALGVALGVTFGRFWPLPEEAGFERIIRTILIGAPAIGLGIGLQLMLQGPKSRQALYLIFALSAWLGSGILGPDESDGTEESDVLDEPDEPADDSDPENVSPPSSEL